MPLRRPIQGRRVVVTGLGAVAPNGVGREAFWQATRDGRSGVDVVQGFDVDELPTRIAGQVLDFDPLRLAPAKDLKHLPRVALLAAGAAEEALADSGLDPRTLDVEEQRAFGVCVGSGGVALGFAERQFREYYLGNRLAVSLYAIPSATPGAISSELSMRFGLRGPSHVISTGCTSSSDAIGHALSLVRYGRADRMLVGGADAPVAPGIMIGFSLMKIMSSAWNDEPDRASRPFSRDRDGFVLAEGAWMLVLEAEPVARARGARVYGEILGYGATCEAFHRVRLNESGDEPARAMLLAIEDAGLAPEDIDHLNLHGTSTPSNDRIEARAVHKVFNSRGAKIPCAAIKSVIGHPQGACGAAGVVAELLAMRDRFLPPTINHDAPDPECELDVVAHEGRTQPIETALCNCLGFGSKNAALVLRGA